MKIINKSLNNAEQNKEEIYVLQHEFLRYLKEKAYQSESKTFRYNAHTSNSHLTQEMIIASHREVIGKPHRHPSARSESYHLIEGSMNVYFFNDDGKPFKAIRLEEISKRKNFYYRLTGSAWHLPVATSEFVIYHETLTGPFLGQGIHSEYPSWLERYNTKDKIANLITEITPQ